MLGRDAARTNFAPAAEGADAGNILFFPLSYNLADQKQNASQLSPPLSFAITDRQVRKMSYFVIFSPLLLSFGSDSLVSGIKLKFS
jgi:hypothetical protein